MFKIIRSILIFVFSIIVVSITSYLYLYKGFIQLPEGNKIIIHKEKVISKEIKEKTYTIEEILEEIIKENKYHYISDIILQFIKNKNPVNINISIKLKKDAINQINNLLNKNIFKENTDNEIYININNTESDTIKYIDIYGFINSKKIIIRGYYLMEDQTLVLNYLKIDGFLSLMNDKGITDFINDGFNIKYGSIIGKKIALKDFLSKIDTKIPESKKDEIKAIILGIENFVKLKNNKELNFLFSDKLKQTSSKVKTYILTNKNLSVGQKQNLIISLIDLIKKLDNTYIFIDRNKFQIKNEDSKYLFNYNITLTKDGKNKVSLKDFNLKGTETFSINDIYKYILKHNKILVKYLNGEDFLFLINDKK